MQKIKLLVDAGKASAGPPIGSTLGPLGVNVGEIVKKINEVTSSFSGMKIPVTLLIDPKDRSYEVKVGTPPASALILKELGIEKGASNPKKDNVGSLNMEKLRKIAEIKMQDMLSNNIEEAVKEVMGTCRSMGVQIEA